MTSELLSPTPPISRPFDSTVAEAPEVRQPSSLEVRNDVLTPELDLNCFYQNNAALQSLLAANFFAKTPSTLSTQPALPAKQDEQPRARVVKQSRTKLFANGFFMTFDKLSSCGKRQFWRCEYKNTCKARMHTDPITQKIITFINAHSHGPPADEEIQLYNINPDDFDRDRVYIIKVAVDPMVRRKTRKQAADRRAEQRRLDLLRQIEEEKELRRAQAALSEATIKTENDDQVSSVSTGLDVVKNNLSFENTDTLLAASNRFYATTKTFSGDTETALSSLFMAYLPLINRDREAISSGHVSPSLPSSSSSSISVSPDTTRVDDLPCMIGFQDKLKRACNHLSSIDENQWKNDPLFTSAFQIAYQLRKLWGGEPSSYPRSSPNPTTHFSFFLAKDDGNAEQVFTPVHIAQRDGKHIRDALENFIGRPCNGMLVFGVTPRMSVLLSEPLLSEWDNNQYFLLNIKNGRNWRLKYVDDRISWP